MDFKDKKVLVFGSGISGIGACELLEKSGATVILFDGNEKLHEEAIRMKLPSASKAQILIGQISDEQLKELDLVVLSPGVPTDLPVVEKMKAAGIRGACRVMVGDEVKFACVDGPEFDGHKIDFDVAMKRQTLYKTEEGRALLKLREGDTHHGGCGNCGGDK